MCAGSKASSAQSLSIHMVLETVKRTEGGKYKRVLWRGYGTVSLQEDPMGRSLPMQMEKSLKVLAC